MTSLRPLASTVRLQRFVEVVVEGKSAAQRLVDVGADLTASTGAVELVEVGTAS